VVAAWEDAAALEPGLLRGRARGPFWELLAALEITLFVTREYEHLLVALNGSGVSYLRLPHPSGVAVPPERDRLLVASTRNPNQLFELRPATGLVDRADVDARTAAPLLERRPLVPSATTFLPGSTYLHDLAFIGPELHGNSVGTNSVVTIDAGGARKVWWPRCIEVDGTPRFERNYIQLNSIAAGPTLEQSFFSASSDKISSRRPSHQNYPVDGRGVIFAGGTRDPVVRGLTRPHSARLQNGVLWVDNSGYGELARVEGGRAEVVSRLPGWTRGLCFNGRYAFVGTSRVLQRFQQYAPGLDIDRCSCGVHVVDLETGALTASLTWPAGDQIFALEWMPNSTTRGLPFTPGGARWGRRERMLFYAYAT